VACPRRSLSQHLSFPPCLLFINRAGASHLPDPELEGATLLPGISGGKRGQATFLTPSLRSNLVSLDQRCIGLTFTTRVLMKHTPQTEIQIADDVKRALNAALPVVALEST